MKRFFLLVPFFFIMIFFILPGYTFGEDMYGIIIDYSGFNEYRNNYTYSQWKPVTHFLKIPEGTSIKTGKNSSVVIQKSNGNLIRIVPESAEVLKGNNDNTATIKPVALPSSISKAFKSRIFKINETLESRKGKAYVKKTSDQNVNTTKKHPELTTRETTLSLCNDTVYLPQKSMVIRDNVVLAWDGAEKEYEVKITAPQDNMPIFIKKTYCCWFVLKELSNVLKRGKKYQVEIKTKDSLTVQSIEPLGKEEEESFTDDLESGRIPQESKEMSVVELIMLGTLYEQYGLFNDALRCYQKLKDKNIHIADACLLELKKKQL